MLDEAMKQALRLPHADEVPLDVFITEVFVACEIGDVELDYEPADRVLRWRDLDDAIVHTSFAAKHLLDLQVNGPSGQGLYRGARLISDHIPEHRMKADDEEILGVSSTASAADVKRARKDGAKLYHTDKHQQLEKDVKHVLDLRMKEQNAAADRLLARLKRHGKQ
jgi:hypothetical protein